MNLSVKGFIIIRFRLLGLAFYFLPLVLWFPRRAELREVGGGAEIALGKSRSAAWRRWCGRSGGLLPHLPSHIV